MLCGKLEPGSTIGYHIHDTSSEIIFILSGKADYIMDDSTEIALPGQAHYCPKGHSHSMINNYDEDICVNCNGFYGCYCYHAFRSFHSQ